MYRVGYWDKQFLRHVSTRLYGLTSRSTLTASQLSLHFILKYHLRYISFSRWVELEVHTTTDKVIIFLVFEYVWGWGETDLVPDSSSFLLLCLLGTLISSNSRSLLENMQCNMANIGAGGREKFLEFLLCVIHPCGSLFVTNMDTKQFSRIKKNSILKQYTSCMMTILCQGEFKEQTEILVKLLLYITEFCFRNNQVWIYFVASE
jgi:hypothetical protein